MYSVYLYAFLGVSAVSLVSLLGVATLAFGTRALASSTFFLVSLAVGALLGDAFIHLIPEAFAGISDPLFVSLAILAGILIFFILEKFLHWHHHHRFEDEEPEVHPVGAMVLVSDGVHNFIDGLIIGASFLVSPAIGIATTLAVFLHEIPQEIGDFGILVAAGYSKTKALWLNFLSALAAVAGTAVALLLGVHAEGFTTFLVPIAAGGFIYVAMSDLIPELHKAKKVRLSIIQIAAMLLGMLAMVALLAVE